MTCVPFSAGAARGIACYSPEHTVTHAGRTWRFEMHSYLGPTLLRRDGEPYKRQPGERHPFWQAFSVWCTSHARTTES